VAEDNEGRQAGSAEAVLVEDEDSEGGQPPGGLEQERPHLAQENRRADVVPPLGRPAGDEPAGLDGLVAETAERRPPQVPRRRHPFRSAYDPRQEAEDKKREDQKRDRQEGPQALVIEERFDGLDLQEEGRHEQTGPDLGHVFLEVRREIRESVDPERCDPAGGPGLLQECLEFPAQSFGTGGVVILQHVEDRAPRPEDHCRVLQILARGMHHLKATFLKLLLQLAIAFGQVDCPDQRSHLIQGERPVLGHGLVGCGPVGLLEHPEEEKGLVGSVACPAQKDLVPLQELRRPDRT
jgi:hypothetical protein